MAGPRTLFDIQTDPPIAGMKFALDKLADGVSDFSGLFDGYDEIFRTYMVQQFTTEGGFGAGGWHPLSPAYDAWKREHYPGRPIGVLTGALRSSMTGGQGYSARLNKTEASYGMDRGSKALDYGQYFHKGTPKMPARPVIQWSAEQSRAFQKHTHVWLHWEVQDSLGKMPHGAKNPAVPGAFGGGL